MPGGVPLALAARGAAVLGLDRDAGMIEVAEAEPMPGKGRVPFVQLAEIRRKPG